MGEVLELDVAVGELVSDDAEFDEDESLPAADVESFPSIVVVSLSNSSSVLFVDPAKSPLILAIRC